MGRASPAADANASVTVTALAPPTTDVLTISVKADSPNVAAAFANAIGAHVIALQPHNSLYSIAVLQTALPPSTPSNPTKPLLFAAVGFGVIAAVFAGLASAGVREGVGAVAPNLGRLFGLAPKVVLSTVLKAAPRMAGKDLLDMWRVHGPKIAGQTRQLLDALIVRGDQRASATGTLKELRRRLG